jgi:uncharacterized protein YfaS (alpha-2-macroglobulin family)
MSRRLISIITSIAVIVVGIFSYHHFNDDKSVSIAAASRNGYKLVPTKEDATGVLLDSQFIFESDNKEVTPKELVDGLKINDNLEFFVEKIKENQFRVKLKDHLKKNSIYKFVFTNSEGTVTSWVYQTSIDFQILGSLPADKSTMVPINTGIELYCSQNNIENIDKYFNISPSVEGTFKTNGRTVIFVPKELKPATLYTVTVKKGLHVKDSKQTLENDYAFEFETGVEKYDESENYYFSFFRTMFEFSSNESVSLPVNYYNGDDEKELKINTKVYSFKDYESFVNVLENENKKPIWSNFTSKKYSPNTDKLKQIMDFEVTLPKSYDYSNAPQIKLPDKLNKGAYLVQCNYKDLIFYTYVQVTDIAVYSGTSNEKLLFWVNSISNKKPVKHATVSIEDQKHETDDNGIATLKQFKLDDDAWVKYATISSKNDICIVPVMKTNNIYERKGNINVANNYWNYMHLDKNLYKPSDTINVWGFVKSRYDASKFDNLTIEVSEDNYWAFDRYLYWFPSLNEPLLSKKVKVNGNFYEGDIQLPALAEGSYNILIKSGDNVISSQYFSVQNYTKPAYKLNITKDKKAIFVGDKINFEIKGSFFEGTSLPDLLVNYSLRSTNNVKNKKMTDDKGLIKISHMPRYSAEEQGEVHGYINAYATLPESGEIYVNEKFRVFNNNININAKGKIENEKNAILDVVINEIDLTKINKGTEENYNDYLGKVVEGKKITGVLYKNYYEKIETGEYYDYINKVVRKTYDYKHKKDKIKDFTATTDKEGKINLTFDLKDTTECYYTAEIKTYDNNNKKMEKSVWFSKAYSPYEDQDLRLETNKEKYNIGEEVKITLKNVEKTQYNNYLFILTQKDILNHAITKSPNYSIKFDKSFIPNISVTGVYFNGKTYIYTHHNSIRYDYDNSKLKIKATTDKEEYKPGETCKIELFVTDKNDKPVSGVVNASIVDESLFALSDMEYYVLETLYQSVDTGEYSSYGTHRSDKNGNIIYGFDGIQSKEAAKSDSLELTTAVNDRGTSNGATRKRFLDVALFKSVNLNKEGKGTISFKLPDNITSWRISMVGITNNLYGGSEVVNLNVSLPFFINSTINENYLIGDKPYIGVTAYGDGVKKDDKVVYEVTSPQIKEFKETYNGKAYERINIPLFKLSEDKYDIIVSAKSGSYEDSVKYSFNVSSTYKTSVVAEYNKATKNMTIPAGTKGLTDIIFTNKGRGKYIPNLYDLAYSYGNRIDQKLVAKKASNILETMDKNTLEEDYILSAYQKEDGGLSLLPYSSSDILVTVDNLPIITDEFNIARIKAYLYKKLQDGATFEKTASVYGLSVTGEPVLTQLEKIKELEDIDFKGYIYIALSYSELGDRYMAESIYNEKIKPYIEEYNDYARVIYSEDEDTTYELTAMVAYLLSETDNDIKDKLFNYVNNNYSTKVLIDNYKLAYINNEFSNIEDEPISIKYKYDGKDYTVKLTDTYSKTISIPSQKINDLEIVSTTDNVGVISVYDKQLTDLGKVDSNISLTRKYYDMKGKQKTTFKEGDIVKVVINYNINNKAIDNYYRITDYLPSGIKPLENYYGFSKDDEYHYRGDIDGQKVSFYAYKNNKNKKPIVYYGRIVSLGEYKADEAIIQGQIVKDSMNFSKSNIIKIVE